MELVVVNNDIKTELEFNQSSFDEQMTNLILQLFLALMKRREKISLQEESKVAVKVIKRFIKEFEM